MFKVSKNLVPPQMHEIFKLKDQLHYNLSYNSLFFRPLVKSAYKGTESLLFLGPKIWDILPDTYKDMPHLNSFKLYRDGDLPIVLAESVRFILPMLVLFKN